MNIVEQYWSSVVTRLQSEVDGFNKLIGHAGEQGRENELSLSRLLENLIPRRLGVGSGVVIDATNMRSKQTDIIVYDLADQPTLMAQSSQVIFPVEVVHAVIEVKTNLTADEVADCAEKKASIHALSPAPGHALPFFGVLAYDAWASPKTVATHVRDLEATRRPDSICVMNPGLIGGPNDSDPNQFDFGLVPLHERAEDGTRTAQDWVRVENPPANAMLGRYGSTYPVTRIVGQPGFWVGEPGRALLLFCHALLQSLSDRGAIPALAMSHYLTSTAKETLQITTAHSDK